MNFSRSLANEMMSEKVDVDIVCLAPGQVVSGMNEGPETIMVSASVNFRPLLRLKFF